jgi:TIR domain
MSDIFISYASADRERAKLLSKALQRRGWSVWWDRSIPPGKEYDQVIEEALDSAQCVVVLWSQASVASSWVKTESAEAMRRKILMPALIEEVKIPLEFRRLQAADLSHWRGEPDDPGLEEFFQSIDRTIHGGGGTEGPVTPAKLPPVQPRAHTQPVHWTRSWRAAALIAAVVGVVVGLTLWRSQQDESGPSVPPQEVSAPAQVVSPPITVPAVPDVVDAARAPRPEPVRQPPVADPRVTDRPAATNPRPPAREPGRAADGSNTPKPSTPAGGAPADVKPVTLTALPESPTTPPASAPSETATTPARAPDLPVASPKQFEEIVLVVTKDGETEELEVFLLFENTSLVLKDEDSNVLRTVPYRNIQKITYSPTQRRIVVVRTTRHWLTLNMGREEILLRVPDATHLSIMSQIEQRTGIKIVRPAN